MQDFVHQQYPNQNDQNSILWWKLLKSSWTWNWISIPLLYPHKISKELQDPFVKVHLDCPPFISASPRIEPDFRVTTGHPCSFMHRFFVVVLHLSLEAPKPKRVGSSPWFLRFAPVFPAVPSQRVGPDGVEMLPPWKTNVYPSFSIFFVDQNLMAIA